MLFQGSSPQVHQWHCSWDYAHRINIWASNFLRIRFVIFSLTQSQPSLLQNHRQGLVCEASSWWAQLLQLLKVPLFPHFAVHNTALFSSYFDRRDISALQVRIWRSVEPSFTHYFLMLFLHFRSAFAEKLTCYDHCLFISHFYISQECSSQASWTNTTEWHRWDTLIMLTIKNCLCTDDGEKSAALQ